MRQKILPLSTLAQRTVESKDAVKFVRLADGASAVFSCWTLQFSDCVGPSHKLSHKGCVHQHSDAVGRELFVRFRGEADITRRIVPIVSAAFDPDCVKTPCFM